MALKKPFFMPRLVAFDTGVVSPGAKLYFYQTGTTTDQSVYQTAAHDASAHAQPVVADASGEFAPIYLDPEAGFDYTVTLKDSDDVEIWTVNAIPRYTENFETGNYTGSWAGFSADPSNVGATWYRQGNIVNLILPIGTGTSNATTMSFSGMDSEIRPTTQQYVYFPYAEDNSAHLVSGAVGVINTSGTVSFAPGDAAFDTSGWTSSGTKGILGFGSCFYRLRDT